MHKLGELYQTIYRLGPKLPKRDRFGIHLHIEHRCLEALELAISAALGRKENKPVILNTLRIKIEVLKRLVRTAHETNVLEVKQYSAIIQCLQEISKMVNGWIRYLT